MDILTEKGFLEYKNELKIILQERNREMQGMSSPYLRENLLMGRLRITLSHSECILSGKQIAELMMMVEQIANNTYSERSVNK